MKWLIVLSLSAALCSCDNTENSSNKMAKEENKEKFDSTDLKRDAEFALQAAAGGLMEVELGKMAESNGVSSSVKQFGRDMVSDHSKVNDELKSLAASKNMSLPTMPNYDQQKKIDELRQKQGRDFDKAYIHFMVDDHKEDIDHFQKEADKGKDPELREWASQKVATLQHHLQMAQEIQSELKN